MSAFVPARPAPGRPLEGKGTLLLAAPLGGFFLLFVLVPLVLLLYVSLYADAAMTQHGLDQYRRFFSDDFNQGVLMRTQIAQAVPGAEVVKGFNTIFAQVLTEGSNLNGQKVTVFVASDSERAKQTARALAESRGSM